MSPIRRLDEPLELGPVRLANRAVLCTAGVDLADPDGRLTDVAFDWLVDQARRGWGMVLLEFDRGVGPPTLRASQPERIARLAAAMPSVPLGISTPGGWNEEVEAFAESGVAAIELGEPVDRAGGDLAIGLRLSRFDDAPLPHRVDWVHLGPDDELAERMWAGSPLYPLLDEVPDEVSAPLMLSGRVKDAAAGEQLREMGVALVGLGRGALADPDLIDRARRNEPWMPCTGCMACRVTGDGPGCAVTPLGPFAPGAGDSSWTIVGASPSALRVAIALHRGGHPIVLFTGGQPMGGSLRLRGRIPELAECVEAAAHLRRTVRECGFEVRHELPDFIETDHVFVSLPGVLADEDVVDAREVMDQGGRFGQRYAVRGESLLAAETAVLLAMKGIEVTLLCPPDRIASDTVPAWRHRWTAWLSDHRIPVVAPADADPDVDVVAAAPVERLTHPVADAIAEVVPDTIAVDDPYEPISQRIALETAFGLVVRRLAYM